MKFDKSLGERQSQAGALARLRLIAFTCPNGTTWVKSGRQGGQKLGLISP